jgi:hypothetical protein
MEDQPQLSAFVQKIGQVFDSGQSSANGRAMPNTFGWVNAWAKQAINLNNARVCLAGERRRYTTSTEIRPALSPCTLAPNVCFGS